MTSEEEKETELVRLVTNTTNFDDHNNDTTTNDTEPKHSSFQSNDASRLGPRRRFLGCFCLRLSVSLQLLMVGLVLVVVVLSTRNTPYATTTTATTTTTTDDNDNDNDDDGLIPFVSTSGVVYRFPPETITKIHKYRETGTALLVHIHITHHAGTQVCHVIGRGLAPVHPHNAPPFACRIDVRNKQEGLLDPHLLSDPRFNQGHIPWTHNETQEKIDMIRPYHHMIAFEVYRKVPNPTYQAVHWEHDNLLSTIVMRDPLSRLLVRFSWSCRVLSCHVWSICIRWRYCTTWKPTRVVVITCGTWCSKPCFFGCNLSTFRVFFFFPSLKR